MNWLQIILLIYFMLMLLSIIFYIPKIKCWIYGFKKTPKLFNPNKSKLAIVVPARNESECIPQLFASINKQTYDKNLFDIYLVVDREDDESIQIAHNMLDNVDIIVEKNQTCKADAVDSAIKHILNKHSNIYDAYIIIDADNILKDNYIEEMNNALSSNADIIFGKKLIKNWQSKEKKNRTLFTNLSALTYTALDTMGNKYKSSKGYALIVIGQGLMLSNRFIEKYQGFPFKSLCEDVEVGMNAMLYDFKQFYYEHALIYSEEPITHKEYNKRRYRWLKGYFDNNKKYRKQLVNKTFKQGKVVRSNLYFMYELYPVYFMLGLTAAMLITFLVSSLVLAIKGLILWKLAFKYALFMMFIIYACIALFNFVTVIEDKDSNKMTALEKLKVIFVGPFITFGYVNIFLKTLRTNYKVSWEHVERIKIDEEN